MGRTARLHALTLSLTLILVGAEALVLHQHRGDAPALYDEQCPLSQLAASWTKVGVTRVVHLIQPLPTVDLALPPMSRVASATSILPCKPRGPPNTA